MWTWGDYADAFGAAYGDYVNPWNDSTSVPVDSLDSILTGGTMIGQGTAVVAGTAAGVIVVTGVGAGVTITGTGVAVTIGTEIVDTATETAIEAATGYPIPLPMSPVDVIQDGAKICCKKGWRAVSQAELDDLYDIGEFRPKPNQGPGNTSMDSKWFCVEETGAQQALNDYPDLDVVVGADIPPNVTPTLEVDDIDGYGPGFVIGVEDLPQITPILPKR
jgi:hypothetical protein